MNKTPPARFNVLVLKQILNLIPRGMINLLALETGVDAKARTFFLDIPKSNRTA